MTTTPTIGTADLPGALTVAVDCWFAKNTGLGGCSDKDVRELADIFRIHALAAGQATAAQAVAEPAKNDTAYAELPEPDIAVGNDGRALIYTSKDIVGEPYYAADQLRAFADATHALRASHGQAPASVLHLVNSAFAEIAMAFPKAFALHKVGIADKAVLKALAAPAGAQADSVQEDAACWHWLAEYLVGPRTDLDDEIVASETVNDLRKLVESARKQGANHDR